MDSKVYLIEFSVWESFEIVGYEEKFPELAKVFEDIDEAEIYGLEIEEKHERNPSYNITELPYVKSNSNK